MTLQPLYDSKKGIMQVAGLMSGSGTNLRRIIEQEVYLRQNSSSPYHVAVIFSDTPESNAATIGKEHDIPVVVNDKKLFYKNRGKPLRDLTVRAEFDSLTVEMLKPYNINVAAYAGYMSIATMPLINAFLGINVHPADLSILNEQGKPKYVGDHVVRDAILAGEKNIYSTTHIISGDVDCGQILMVSSPIEVILENFDSTVPQNVVDAEKSNQDRLKKDGDWIIFPKTILDIAQGRFSFYRGVLCYDEKPVPHGLRLGK